MYTRATLKVVQRLAAAKLRDLRSRRSPAILGYAIEHRAHRDPERLACVFENDSQPEEQVTLGQLNARSQALACELLDRDLKPGDRFAVFAPNYPEMLYAFAAASLTGTVAVPVDPRNKGDLLAYILGHSEAKLLIFADSLLDETKAVLSNLPSVKQVFVIESERPPGATGFEPIRPLLAKDRALEGIVHAPDLMAPFQIIYTSGTTGNPKGVVQPNARFFFMSMLGYFFGYGPSDILYTGLSLSHGNSQGVTVYPALELGIPAVISRRFTKRRIWDVCRRYGVTSFSLLGGMASGIYNESPRQNDSDHPARMVVSAGFPMALWHDFEKRFALRLLEWYASVEGGFTFRPIAKGPDGSFGKNRIPGIIDFRIVDENDRDVPPGERGEIVSRMRIGPTKVDYLRNREASDEKTRGGWLRSGDIGHMDRKGWMFFDHRKGRSLRRQGDFVPADFVEKAIGETGHVTEVYVYGVPASSGAPGEVDLVAAVVLRDGARLDPLRIFEACRARLPANFVPSYVQVMDEIPKTPSEKPRDEFLKSTFNPSATNVHRLAPPPSSSTDHVAPGFPALAPILGEAGPRPPGSGTPGVEPSGIKPDATKS